MDDVEAIMLEVFRKLEEEEKPRLEIDYGLLIHRDALILTIDIVRRYFYVGGGDGIEQKVAVGFLEQACATLRQELDTNSEELEGQLNLHEYLLRCTLVELNEIKKDKDHLSGRPWHAHLKRELKDLEAKFEVFARKWTPLLASACRRMVEHTHQLKEVCQQLRFCLHEVESANSAHSFAGVLQRLDATLTQLLQGIHKNIRKNMCVRPHHIAKVASPLTGVPASWLLRSSKPPFKGLASRLIKRHIGYKNAIRAICNAVSRPKPAESGARPLGAFLLCGDTLGRLELAEALAEQLFDDKDMLIRFDLSEYADSDSLSRLIGAQLRPEDQVMEGLLTEAVKKRPFSVLFFDNFDLAHGSVVDVFIDILRGGVLTDALGKSFYFTNTLIIMTPGKNQMLRHSCPCLLNVKKYPLKVLLNRDKQKCIHEYPYFRLMREAQRQFKPELFELLDDIVFCVHRCIVSFVSVTRVHLRDIASGKIGKGLVLYASAPAAKAILGNISVREGGEKAILTWLEENLVPLLLNICGSFIDDNPTIYIDTLAGTKEVSYRLENNVLMEAQILEQFKKFSEDVRIIYGKEKKRFSDVCALRKKHFDLNTTISNAKCGTDLVCVAGEIRELINMMDGLISSAVDMDSVVNEDKLTENSFDKAVDFSLGESAKKRAKKVVDGLRARLCNKLIGKSQAFNVVAEALLRRIDLSKDLPCPALISADAPAKLPPPVSSFLFLGLAAASKADFVKDLAEHLVTDDGVDLLIQINLSEYTYPDSLSRLMDGLMRFYSCDHSELFLLVQMRPYHVLFFDQVEKVHMSVFSALLSVLDHGKFRDSLGRTVDLRNSVIIIASDLGNTEMIAQLFGRTLQASSSVHDRDIKVVN